MSSIEEVRLQNVCTANERVGCKVKQVSSENGFHALRVCLQNSAQTIPDTCVCIHKRPDACRQSVIRALTLLGWQSLQEQHLPLAASPAALCVSAQIQLTSDSLIQLIHKLRPRCKKTELIWRQRVKGTSVFVCPPELDVSSENSLGKKHDQFILWMMLLKAEWSWPEYSWQQMRHMCCSRCHSDQIPAANSTQSQHKHDNRSLVSYCCSVSCFHNMCLKLSAPSLQTEVSLVSVVGWTNL